MAAVATGYQLRCRWKCNYF